MVAQTGSAYALGAGGRRFKSYRPDYNFVDERLVSRRHFCVSTPGIESSSTAQTPADSRRFPQITPLSVYEFAYTFLFIAFNLKLLGISYE